MRSSFAPLVVRGLSLFGCASPSAAPTPKPADPGSAGSTGTPATTLRQRRHHRHAATRPAPARGNTTGSGTGNTTGSGTAGTTGTAGTGGPACVSDPTNLVRTGGWICDADAPYMIQGAWYGYGDGTSCPAPTANPCTSGSCCMMGTTVVDTTYAALGLRHRHGAVVVGRHDPDQERLRGPGEVLQHHAHRQQRRQPGPHRFLAEPDARRRTRSRRTRRSRRSRAAGRARSASPTSPAPAGRSPPAPAPRAAGDGTPVDMQIQIPGGDRAGTFNVCISKIEPVQSRQHRHRRLGRRHDELRDAERLRARSRPSTATRTSCARRTTSSRTTPGARPRGQTITFGPGTKMKVTVQNETRTGNSTPAGYPSILTGAYNNRSTTRQRPAARGQLRSPRAAVHDQLDLGRQRRDRQLQRRLRRLVQHRLRRRSGRRRRRAAAS